MLFCIASALAGTQVTIKVVLPQEAQDAGLDADELTDDLDAAIGEQLHLDALTPYMEQMANANVLSAKGMGVDYASDMQRFDVGGSIGTAVSGAGFAFTAGDGGLPTAGFALQIGAMAGLNLGAFSPPESALRRFRIYVNGMSATTRRDPFDATFLNYGAHLQIQAIKGGDKTDGLRWGGLDVTTGYEYSSYSLTLTEGMPVEADSVRWDATGAFTLAAHAQSIPLEVSTNLHVFVVTVFAGVGADYNVSGAADLDVGVDGPISVSWDGREADAGAAGAHLQSTGDAGTWVARGFAGVQADIFFVKLYGQLNVTIDQSVGGHVGVRLSF